MPSAPVVETSAPAHLWIPPRSDSLGDIAVDLAEVAGLVLDEHQVLAIDAMQSVDADGRWILENCIVEPRQNGKSVGVIMPIVLAAAIFLPGSLIVWSAHRYKASHEAFLAVLKLLGEEDNPTEIGEQVSKRSFGSGDEGFDFHNGSRIIFVARSAASGRGLSGDVVVLDEALFLTAAMMGALFPMLSARPNPMIIYASSAGFATSEVLRDVRDRGRAGSDPSLAYVEWCAPDGGCTDKDCDHAKDAVGCAADGPENWMRANPATAAGRMTLDYIAKERRALPVAEFLRERMGWWESADRGGLFHMPDWWRLADPQSIPGPSLSMAVHITPDRSRASVAVGSMRGDGRLHVELIRNDAGVSWVLPYIMDRTARHNVGHLAIAGAMAAGALAPDLEGIHGFQTLNATETRRACAGFYDWVNEDDPKVAVRPHPDLDAAVQAATRSSERGEWVYDAAPDIDLSPLYAAALAAWVARTGSNTSPGIW